MRIDAHQHFWNYAASDPAFAWINHEMAAIRRSFSPDELAPELVAHGLDASVLVQVAQTLEENRYLLDIAKQHEFVKGVVGWVDLCAEDVGATLDALVLEPKFKGVRRIVEVEPAAIMLDPAFQRGIAALGPRQLSYDILVYAHQLPEAIELARCFPEQCFVVDHVAKPPIKKGEVEPWARHMRDIGREPNVWCKVSGMVTEADRAAWQPDQLRPYLDVVFEAFSPSRLMFGSDWPVCLLAASYADVYRVVDDYTAGFSEADRSRLFGDTAAEFYRI
jgi:L-fuconolactonase